MEHWSLEHERGLIELYTGTNRQLRVIDPDFPEGKDRQRLLVLVKGEVRYRSRSVAAERLSLEKYFTRPLPGKYGGGVDYSRPFLEIRSNWRDTFLTGVAVHSKKGIDVVPPPGDSQLEQRNRESSDWQKRFYAITDQVGWSRIFWCWWLWLPLLYSLINLIVIVTGVAEPETLYVKIAAALVFVALIAYYGLKKNKEFLQKKKDSG